MQYIFNTSTLEIIRLNIFIEQEAMRPLAAQDEARRARAMKVTTVYESDSLDLFTLIRNRSDHF